MNSKPLFLHDDLDKYFYNRKNDIKKIRISDKLLKLLLASTNPINWTEGCWKDIPFKKNNG